MDKTVTIVARLPGKRRTQQNVATIPLPGTGIFEWQADRDCLIVGLRTSARYVPLDAPRVVHRGDRFVHQPNHPPPPVLPSRT